MASSCDRIAGGWRAVLFCAIAALLVRGSFVWLMRDHLKDDPDGYRQLAATLSETGRYAIQPGSGDEHSRELQPTAYRPPLYPLLIAVTGSISPSLNTAVIVLHLTLGVLTVLIVVSIGKAWSLGWASYFAAFLVAFDPILLNQSALVMTETLAAFLAVAILAVLTTTESRTSLDEHSLSGSGLQPRLSHKTLGRAAATGAIFGCAVLARPTFLVWLMLSALAFLCIRRPLSKALSTTAVIVVTAAAVLTPWTVRNLLVLDNPVFATTHGGYTLLLGNNPAFYDFLRGGPSYSATWDSRELDAEYTRIRRDFGEDEVAADRWAYEQAFRHIKAEPRMFLYASAVRVSRLWRLVPHQTGASESTLRRLSRYVVGIWYAHVFGLALLGSFVLARRLCRPPWIWGLLLLVSLTAVHAFYWSNMRMRAPAMPVIGLLAAAGLLRLTGNVSLRAAASKKVA